MPALAQNSDLLGGFDSTILNKLISFDDTSIIQTLGKYRLWKLNRDLLKGILNLPNPSDILSMLEPLPQLHDMDFSFLPNIINCSDPLSIFNLLANNHHLLRNEKMPNSGIKFLFPLVWLHTIHPRKAS